MALAAWLFALSPNLIAHGAAGHDGAAARWPARRHALPLLALPADGIRRLVLGVGGRSAGWRSRASTRRSCSRRSWRSSGGSGAGWRTGRWSGGALRADAPGRSWGWRAMSWSCWLTDHRGHGLRALAAQPAAGRSSQHRRQVRQPRSGRWISRALRDADPAGLGRLRHPGPPPDVGRTELSVGRAADDRLVVLLPRRARGEGAR